MGGGRTRAAYAYRDLDEEVFLPPLEHAYHSQESPLVKPLSESVILRSHFDKTRTRRRQLMLAAGGLLLFGTSALLLLVNTIDAQPRQSSPLELAVAAPYGALRGGGGNIKPTRSVPFAGDLDEHSILEHAGPSVGDADPSDAITATLTNDEDNESDEFYYDDIHIITNEESEDRPWNGLGGYIDDKENDNTQTTRLTATTTAPSPPEDDN